MGLSKNLLTYLSESREAFRGKAILVLGNPFFDAEILKTILNTEDIIKIRGIDRNRRTEELFKSYLMVSEYKILDISQDEGAHYVYDLNTNIKDSSLVNRFDVVIDAGTQEHIFDNLAVLSNVFNFLRRDGLYIFDLPANGFLEHGFRQYSPTFFYDLCFKNRRTISIKSLVLYEAGTVGGINCLDLYSRKDGDIGATSACIGINLPRQVENMGIFTGACMELINKRNRPASIMGCIIKNNEGKIEFRIQQFTYRNSSLSDITAGTGIGLSRQEIIRGAKLLFVKTLMPLSIKLKILKIIIKINNILVKK